MNKLVKFKKENPDYTCIYGLINDKTEELTLKGNHKKIIIDDVEIEIQTGYLFLRNIFGDNLELVLININQIISLFLLQFFFLIQLE
jgi:hypothetical protein